MSDVVIVSAARTPVGSFNGALASLPAHELGSIAIKAAVERAGIQPSDVSEVIMGQVLQAGAGQGPARQASVKAGVPVESPAWSLNQVCGSGLRAVALASQAIALGDSSIVVAGGQESMSNAPFYVYGMRNGVKLGDQKMVDGVVKDGLWCATCEVHMGGHAEYTAKKAGLTRQQQDEFAAGSHRKAVQAWLYDGKLNIATLD